jgi:hypothetical protein
MASYVVMYKGPGMPDTETERKAVGAAWMKWYGGLGGAISDHGNPIGPSRSIVAGGPVKEKASADFSGYLIFQADNIEAATQIAQGCPVLALGGSVDVYETFFMPGDPRLK